VPHSDIKRGVKSKAKSSLIFISVEC